MPPAPMSKHSLVFLLALLLILGGFSIAFAAPPDAERVLREAEAAANNPARAEQLLSTLPSSALDSTQRMRAQILRAEITLARALPEAALRMLPATSADVPQFAPRIERLRAQALFATGDAAGAVRALVARERYLRDATALAENRERIWSGLIATPVAASDYAQLAAQDAMTRGWLELAWLMQQGAKPAALGNWVQRHPGHPGAAKAGLVRGGDSVAAIPHAQPQTQTPPVYAPAPAGGAYALLLPLSGSLAGAGMALRDGFLAAWWSAPEPRPPIRIYDSGGGVGQALAVYEQALREGAGLIVGPLLKDGVAAIAQRGNPPVTVIALNYVDAGAVPAGIVQLGLAPEDEAAAAAERAVAEGRTHALVLTPGNDWGQRVTSAFSQRLQQLGGQVIETARYPTGSKDYGPALKLLLNLDASEARHRSLGAVLGKNSEFEPRPRGDADFFFAAARAEDARVLLPQLDFFRGGALPVYATSVSYPGSAGPELEGLHFCDMPWMIDAAGDWAEARARARALFPEAMAKQPRLMALGGDAWRLAQQLGRGGALDVDGASGRLLSGRDGRVVRRLGCARIVNGRVLALQ